MNFDKDEFIVIAKISFWGGVFSLISYFSLSSLVHITEPELNKIVGFFDNGNMLGWFSYRFSDIETAITTVIYWISGAILGTIGFISLVVAKALLSKAETIVKEKQYITKR